MFRQWQNEIPQQIPGVKPVMFVAPYQTDVYTTTETTPESVSYTLTADATFLDNKEYYKKDGDNYVLAVAGTDYTVGDPVTANTFYEKHTIPEATVNKTVMYERYTDGIYPDKDQYGTLMPLEHEIEIIRTTTEASGGHQLITKDHAIGFWANRTSIQYVPICVRCKSNALRESPTMFR